MNFRSFEGSSPSLHIQVPRRTEITGDSARSNAEAFFSLTVANATFKAITFFAEYSVGCYFLAIWYSPSTSVVAVPYFGGPLTVCMAKEEETLKGGLPSNNNLFYSEVPGGV